MQRAAAEGVDHLLVGTSLPWLLPHAIHELERWNETLNVRHEGAPAGPAGREAAPGRRPGALGRVRHSFERLGRSLTAVARGEHGPAPATALVLSGDVHHAYAAELVAPGGLTTRVHQLTVSPLHNQAPHPIQVGFRIGWSRWAQALTGALARLARARRSALRVAQAGRPLLRQPARRAGARGARARASGCRSPSWADGTGLRPGAGPARCRGADKLGCRDQAAPPARTSRRSRCGWSR